jgi:hypothetical protein
MLDTTALTLKGSDDGVLQFEQWFLNYVHHPILKTHVLKAGSAFTFRCR